MFGSLSAMADACEATRKSAAETKRIFIMLGRLQTRATDFHSAARGRRHVEIRNLPPGVSPGAVPGSCAGQPGGTRRALRVEKGERIFSDSPPWKAITANHVSTEITPIRQDYYVSA